MSGYDIYVLCLCLIVFTLLTILFSVMLTSNVKLTIKSIKNGLEDEQIITKYQKEARKAPRKRFFKRLSRVFCALIVAVLCSISIWCCFADAYLVEDIPTPNVVLSSSMSRKHQVNEYLNHNNLDDQFDMFDLLFTRDLPNEFDLKLYDIVIY